MPWLWNRDSEEGQVLWAVRLESRGLAVEEWGAMFQLLMRRSTESFRHLEIIGRTPIDELASYRDIPIGMRESEVIAGMRGEVKGAQQYYDIATSCTPEDSALAPSHSAFSKYLGQYVALMRALQHRWEGHLYAERSGYRQCEKDAYLAAQEEVKEAHALYRARLAELRQIIGNLSDNEKELLERLNLRSDDP